MRNLSKNGLSMSQAQSISNLCNQNAQEIQSLIDGNNICSKSIKVDREIYMLQEASPIPSHILELLKLKGQYHATQAFLMEAIKSKESEMDRLRRSQVDISHLEKPVKVEIPDFDVEDGVNESWGWWQLTDAEYSEYLEAEAYAAHLGQYIHKNGKLTTLRKELANTPSIEWFNVETGKNTPVTVKKHHTSNDLLQMHEEIASAHRQYEQRVNYYKAKVKNLVSDENARIQKSNADKAAAHLALEKSVNEDFRIAYEAYTGEVTRLTMEFNAQRELDIKAVAALRINVDPRFQSIIDRFITVE